MNYSNTLSSLAGLMACTALLNTAIVAQAPRNHVIVAETGANVDFRFVDPTTGNVTAVTEAGNGFLGGAVSVSVDNSDPNGIYTSAGGSFGGAPLWRLDMDGSTYAAGSATSGVVPFFGSLGRMHYSQHGLLLTLSSVSPGLYLTAGVGAPITSLTSLFRAQDIAVIGDKVYVNSFLSGQPSTIIEYDLATSTVRTLGSSYPTVRSLGTIGGALLAGLENGEIHTVDPVSNVMSLFLPLSLGSIVAIAEGDNSLDTYFATANGEVYDINNPNTPVYVSVDTIVDIDVSRHQQGQVRYGQGCAGALGTPVMVDTGRPAPGSSYSFAVAGAQPMAPSVLALGQQRAMFDLAPLGYAGCTLLNDGLVLQTTIIDAAGNASMPIGIPNLSSLVGSSVMGQYFVFGIGANPLASSNGIEAIVH